MTNRSQATAATGEITIDDKIYQMAPLTDKDIGELDNWIRIRVIQLARDSLSGNESSHESKAIMHAAFEYASSLTWLDKGTEEMITLEGVARLLYQVLKANHPELTPAYLAECIVGDKINVNEALDVFDLLHNVEQVKKKPRARQNRILEQKKQKAKKAKKRKKSVGRKSTKR